MDEIVGRLPWPRWYRWGIAVLFLVVVVSAVIVRSLVAYANLVTWSLLGLAYLRRPVRVQREGITVPRLGGRTRRITWDEVESIAEPGRFETVTTLLLADGRDVALEGVTKEQASAVAGLGGKPIRNRPINRFR